MTTVYLCEKPSQARDIARVLGAKRRSDGCIEDGGGTTVTWCFGHLLEMVPPDGYDPAYKHWALATLPIVPQRWKLTVRKDARKQYATVARLVKQASRVVIATDADREGETIAREVLERCGYRGPVQRLWLSALDDASIRKALGQMMPGAQTEPLYQAGLARARADWLVGMNLTRAYTVAGRAAGGDGVLSVGRVQTPTLRLVVDRDRDIDAFVPAPYFGVVITAETETRERFKAKWVPAKSAQDVPVDQAGRCTREASARKVAQSAEGASARVTAVETKRVKEAAPLPFDLSTLQQEASRRWGMGVQQVLDIAQALYETHKAATYPRTDCPYLPQSQLEDVPKTLQALKRSDSQLAALVDRADRERRSRAWNDKKITAHHAIVPTTAVVDLAKMNADERKVYDLIRRRYLAQFYPHHEYDQTTATVVCKGETYTAVGRLERVRGWRQVIGGGSRDRAGEGGDGRDQALPALRQDMQVPVVHSEVLSKQTQPPAHYTEGTLIAAMKSIGRALDDPKLKQVMRETAGIGTEATRAGIIKTLLDRGFMVHRKKHLISTETGRGLIDALPDEAKDPAMTALWEQSLEDIAQGKGALEAFLERQARWVGAMVGRVRAQGVTVTSAKVHPCSECGKPMQRRKGKNGWFWGCTGYPDCKTTLPDERGKPAPRASAKPAGRCVCGGDIRETPRTWTCADCKATVWKETAGKRVGVKTAMALFAGRRVRLTGLKSRSGKCFEAGAELVDGKVKLLFDGPARQGGVR
jgi:DNA topoisomerase-3